MFIHVHTYVCSWSVRTPQRAPVNIVAVTTPSSTSPSSTPRGPWKLFSKSSLTFLHRFGEVGGAARTSVSQKRKTEAQAGDGAGRHGFRPAVGHGRLRARRGGGS